MKRELDRRSLSRLAAALLASLVAWVPCDASAGDPTGDGANETTVAERKLWRFELDNDFFRRTDNAFTSGWSIQRHSFQHQSWAEMEPSGFSGWISRTVPGLDPQGDQVVKRGTGISQLIFTPENTTQADPQPDAVPWAGMLGWSESWYAFDNRRLNAFQIYVGILGPYSGAEQFQSTIHDLINADDVRGWENQLRTEPLLNINYAFKKKLLAGGTFGQRSKTGADLALGAQAGLGNLVTFADLSLEGRWGWGIPTGFAHLPDPPGRGIMLNPNTQAPGEFYFYFSLALRMTAMVYTVAWDGNLIRESPHPGLEYDHFYPQAVVGFHLGSGRFSAHVSYYYYRDTPFEVANPNTDLSWGNITLEYRF